MELPVELLNPTLCHESPSHAVPELFPDEDTVPFVIIPVSSTWNGQAE